MSSDDDDDDAPRLLMIIGGDVLPATVLTTSGDLYCPVAIFAAKFLVSKQP